MIVVTLPDGSSYAACDELEMGSEPPCLDPDLPTEEVQADAEKPSEDLVIVMRHVKVRKGMKAQLAEMRRDGESERDVVLHLPNRTVRVNGLQITNRTREQTRCTFEGFEGRRVKRYHLKMSHAGREWLWSNLKADYRLKMRNTRRRRDPKPVHVSPLGESVADILGLVWRGLYHMDWSLLSKTDWADEYMIEVRIGSYQDLATWDYNELTQLVVVAHDMNLRLSIAPNGPRGMKLRFWQRHGRFDMEKREDFVKLQPTIEDHVEHIRTLYEVVEQCSTKE